jgi:sulfur carrier protein
MPPAAAPTIGNRFAGRRPAVIIRTRMIRVTVNGSAESVDDGLTLAQLIARYQLTAPRVAVEVNQELVPRRDYGATRLNDGDRIEIVTFVGGG